jgi:hypothetical protein
MGAIVLLCGNVFDGVGVGTRRHRLAEAKGFNRRRNYKADWISTVMGRPFCSKANASGRERTNRRRESVLRSRLVRTHG